MARTRRDCSGFTGSWAGYDDRGHRPADSVGQARRNHRPAAVDFGRLHPRPGRLHDSRRRAGRSPRPPADAPGRALPLRRLLSCGQPHDYRRWADLDALGGGLFWLTARGGLPALPGVWISIPEAGVVTAPRLDVIGAALVVAGVTGLVYGIIEQPALGWTNSTVLASTVSGPNGSPRNIP